MTDKLRKAKTETSKLVDFLVKRDWDNSPELLAILERADKEISKIVDKACSDVLNKLEGSYLDEAQGWANNSITDLNGEPVKINKAEQAKAKTEAKKMRATAAKLRSL